MINILFAFILIKYLQFNENNQHIFECIGKGEEMYLKRGKYAFDLYGGQGGFGYINGQKSGTGGLGAHLYAECYITSETPKLYYIFVGGAGVGNDKNPGSPYSRSNGGFNGGGKGGIKSPNNAAGGGGGSTDIRLVYNDMNTRQVVASGGSGGTFFPGNPGGAICGLSRDNSPEDYFCSLITNTFGDWDEYCKHPSGIGQDGPDRDDTPCSGGGGGYCGGDADIYYDQNWPMTADSGTSYAKNCSTTKLDAELCFFNVHIDIGARKGDGLIKVTLLWECSDENCLYCEESGNKCKNCKNGYLKHNGKCVLKCPINSYQKNIECFDCKEPCYQCKTSSTNCISCIEGYFLYNNKCYDECPNGTFADGEICSLCSQNCYTCSGSANSCTSCKNNYFLYQNKCYLNCSILSNEVTGQYYGKNNDEKKCQKCSDENCAFCEDDFNKCQKCIELYYLNNSKCIHFPTNEFSLSDQFSFSLYFSQSNLFSNSDIFSYTDDFTESKIFSQSNLFTLSLDFTQSFRFSNSIQFSNSNFFSKSIEFSETNNFSLSKVFTESNYFSNTNNFTSSLDFTNSKNFEMTKEFSESIEFSDSSIFSLTNYFSNSNIFTNSQTLQPTIIVCKTRRKRGISKKVLIGIICGFIGLLFLISIIFLIKVNYFKEEKSQSNSNISVSNEEKNIKNEEENETSITDLTDDIDINFWL